MGFHAKGICLAGTGIVGPKGQVVIPAEAREKMGVKPGDKVVALYQEDHKTISFVSEREMQSIIDKMGSHLSELAKSLSK